MPLTLAGRAVGDALARLQEHEIDAEPLVYLWYQFPTKHLASLDAKRDVAGALAARLEQPGADAYAALCRAAEVEEMLALWEDEDPRARRRLRQLLDASGLETPDTGPAALHDGLRARALGPARWIL